MKVRRQFDIDILKLRNGVHHYDFEVDNVFFEEFEDSFMEKGKLKIDLILDKSETLIQANFKIKGWVELVCDRSLEKFEHPIDTEDQLIFKYGSEYSELSDEIISIPRELPTLNIAQYVYEFIGLAVPMKKLHPKFQDDENEEDENEAEGKLIYTTKKEDEEETEDSADDENKDPRWDILNNLKKNLN